MPHWTHDGYNLPRVAGLLAAVALAAPAAVAQHLERVDVARVVVDVRVVGEGGRPVLGLGLDDFRVLIDGRPARLESARWEGERIAEGGPAREVEAPVSDPAAPSAGRLIVLFFQKDLIESRVIGLKLLLDRAWRLVERASPRDRFAVVSFDSHLKVWLDFTTKRERVRRVLDRGILFENPPAVRLEGPPSLASAIAPAAARRAASMEQALALVARALEPIVGAKSLVLFAWGYGRMAGARVFFEPELAEASERLRRSRVTVFSLDVTQAEYHTLEAGLRTIADATGGFYLKTHDLPDVAMARLESALAGHYVLLVERPERPAGTHTIRVELTRAQGTVLARPSYTDR